MKAIGYTRVSTQDQAREGVSLENQATKIKAYCELHNMNLQEIISDEGLSGKTLDRGGMARILGMAEAEAIDAVIVYKLDRLSRKTVDNLNLIEFFENKGVSFHSITEKIDTKSASGKFFLTIISALAQMERDLISERTTDALSHKKQKGEWLGTIPFGFKVNGKHLKPDPAQMKIIKKAKRMRRNGKPIRAIAEALQMSKSVVHRLVNTNLKTLKASYIKALAA